METIEVIVYLLLSVILGGLIIAFISGWDAQGTLKNMQHLFSEPSVNDYEQMTAQEFPGRVLAFWDACGKGSIEKNATFYLKDSVTINKAFLFSAVKQSNLCLSLQSVDQGCGQTEDVEMNDIQGPAIIRIECNPESKKLIIS